MPGGTAAEAKQAPINTGEIRTAAGCDFTHVVKTTVLLADMNDFGTADEMDKQHFMSHLPVRAAAQLAALPKGGLVETEAVGDQGRLTTAS